MNLPNDIIVLDDFLPKSFVERYAQKALDKDFNWFYLENITRSEIPRTYKSTDEIEWIDNPGLTHSVFHDKEWYDPYWALQHSLFICEMFAQKTNWNFNRLYRMKINQLNNAPINNINFPHVDAEYPHDVLLYYINDSDGDTILYNEMFEPSHNNKEIELSIAARIEPKAGRCIKFNGLRYHSSSTPTIAKRRLILNMNLGGTQ
jgi:hypothetical protein